MTIRKFAEKDLPQVLKLCREVRQYHIDILGGYFTEQDDEFEKLGFLNSLIDGNIIALVAENSDGLVEGYLLADKKDVPYLIESKVAHISNFGVAEALRGKGIGKKLMDAFFEICKQEKIDEIRLGVYNKNINAYNFYEHYGFEALEQRMIFKMNNREKL